MTEMKPADVIRDRARSYAEDAKTLADNPDLTTEIPITWGEVYRKISEALFEMAREVERAK